MIEYIYFVKCPGCEDEHFSFFDEAKEFALSCMAQKPIITQIEVNRNDFGECTDSCDLGTVWSWEDMMTDDEPAKSVFTKDDLKCCDTDNDPEFTALDNSLDSVPDNFRKPVPAGMTVEDLVEELEENEDTVECKWCEELFDKSECRYEVDLGWLCDRCQAAIMSRGEPLTFREGHLVETFKPTDYVELEYDDLEVTICGEKYSEDSWDEWERRGSYTYSVSKDDVANTIWENFITEDDVIDVPGGLETLDDDSEWKKFLETHFDTLFAKYKKQILRYYEEDATKEFEEEENERFRNESEYDRYDEGLSLKSMLEELEDADSYSKRLIVCPECGETSFDAETGICISCGFN